MLHGVYSLPSGFRTSVTNLHNHSHAVSLFLNTMSGHLSSENRLFLSVCHVSNIHLGHPLFFSMFEGHIPSFILLSLSLLMSNTKQSSALTFTLPVFFTLLAVQVPHFLTPWKNHYTHCTETSPTTLNKNHYCFLLLNYLALSF